MGEALESLGSDHLRETVQRLAEATNNGCGGRLAELDVLRMLTGLARAGCLRHIRKSQCSRPTRTGAWSCGPNGLAALERMPRVDGDGYLTAALGTLQARRVS